MEADLSYWEQRPNTLFYDPVRWSEINIPSNMQSYKYFVFSLNKYLPPAKSPPHPQKKAPKTTVYSDLKH